MIKANEKGHKGFMMENKNLEPQDPVDGFVAVTILIQRWNPEYNYNNPTEPMLHVVMRTQDSVSNLMKFYEGASHKFKLIRLTNKAVEDMQRLIEEMPEEIFKKEVIDKIFYDKE